MEFAGPKPELHLGELETDPHLPDFQRLRQQIFYYQPSTQIVDTELTNPPDLLIACSWMGASSRNVRKYLSTYQTQLTSTPILLLKQDGGDFFWRLKSTLARNVKLAVSVIKGVVEAKKGESPRMILHIFSNGGSFSAINLADFYRASTREQLPLSALLLDSTPSLPNASRTHEAISESLPKSGPLRVLRQGGLWAHIGAGKAIDTVVGFENITLWLRRKLNDPQRAFMQGDLKRVYIYSKADRLADVEAHAKDVEAIVGSGKVQLEDLVTSRHVGHLLSDGPRYWSIVKKLWKEAVKT